MTTAYATHPHYLNHYHPAHNHPERPERLKAVWQTLDEAGLIERMKSIIPTPVNRELILTVHHETMLRMLDLISVQDKAVLIDADTYALPESYETARLSAGGVVQVVNAVLTGAANNGLAAVRPPGHHATAGRPMGFCLLNNIAIAARFAQQVHQLERVLIVDFDVHHGNGTQDIFYEDPSVLFISVHQYGNRFYPGSGGFDEIGSKAGKGYNINIPLPGGHGDNSYLAIFDQIIRTAANRFQPQIILVSAGFDAHWIDPLAQMRLTLNGFARLTRELIRLANEVCGGKIVFVMEGGYDLAALGHGFCNIAHALLGDTTISDPLGADKSKSPDIQPIIEQVKTLHHLP